MEKKGDRSVVKENAYLQGRETGGLYKKVKSVKKKGMADSSIQYGITFPRGDWLSLKGKQASSEKGISNNGEEISS